MKISSISQSNNFYKKQFFGTSNGDYKKNIKCWDEAYKKTSNIRDCGTAGFLLGLILWGPSQFCHGAKWTKVEKFGAGLIILSALSMLYESYKMGKFYNQEKKNLNG